MAELVPCLVALRSEFNQRAPSRDKASDGWIGDAAHSARDSDHNPDSRGLVHAVDVDEDLRVPGLSMAECVAHIVGRHRSGVDNRLTYVIYERTIWSAAYDWRSRDYSGSNPHDKHAHFSCRRWPAVPSRERDRRSWGIATLGVPVTQPNFPSAAEIATAVHRRVIDRPDGIGADASLETILAYLGSRETIAARARDMTVAELDPRLDAVDAALVEIRRVTDLLGVFDPADGDPEADPIVKRLRYVLANPT